MKLIQWIAAGTLALTVVPAMAQETAVPAIAQEEVASVGAVRPDQMRVRFQIAAMEGVLETAVRYGAERLSQQVQAISPDMLFIAGAARAKGFLLEGYGLFFDVDVPAMRRSIAWSFRTLDRPDRNLELAAQTIRRHLATMNDAGARREMEEALQRIVRTMGPPRLPGQVPGTPGAVTASASAPGRSTPEGEPAPGPAAANEASSVLDDPGLAYTNEVKAALIEAMLEHGGASIPVAEHEWLTVAARDNESRLAAGDRYDVSTIVLRVRGGDLAAFRAGRLTKDEAIAKVEVREY